jgi:hypothetical protein
MPQLPREGPRITWNDVSRGTNPPHFAILRDYAITCTRGADSNRSSRTIL